MDKAAIAVGLLLASCFPRTVQAQTSAKTGSELTLPAAPLYRISFERLDPVAGITASAALRLPFQCTHDGTIFVNFVATTPAGLGIKPPIFQPLIPVSFSPNGKGRTFRLDSAPGVHVSDVIDFYASDSDVIFLIRGSKDERTAASSYPSPESGRGSSDNLPEEHLYLLCFSRDGEYRRVVELPETFRITHVGVFPSGSFLALGFDAKDRSAKLAMLNEDGGLLKFLQIPKEDVPKSMVGGKGNKRPGVVNPAELIQGERAIIIVQNETKLPLLEVSEGGMITAVRPKLPEGEQIDAAIPADRNLYVIVNREKASGGTGGTIYELSSSDGTPLRRFVIGDGHTETDVACVHDGKFLSLDYTDGRIVPLVGSVQPENQQRP